MWVSHIRALIKLQFILAIEMLFNSYPPTDITASYFVASLSLTFRVLWEYLTSHFLLSPLFSIFIERMMLKLIFSAQNSKSKKCKYMCTVHQQSPLMLSVGSFHCQILKHFSVPQPMKDLVLQFRETQAQITTHSDLQPSPPSLQCSGLNSQGFVKVNALWRAMASWPIEKGHLLSDHIWDHTSCHPTAKNSGPLNGL